MAGVALWPLAYSVGTAAFTHEGRCGHQIRETIASFMLCKSVVLELAASLPPTRVKKNFQTAYRAPKQCSNTTARPSRLFARAHRAFETHLCRVAGPAPPQDCLAVRGPLSARSGRWGRHALLQPLLSRLYLHQTLLDHSR